MRLDTQTGEVSLCSQRTVGWACQAMPEDRAVLESEIARLRRENAALKKDILARGLPLPAGTLPEPPVVRDGYVELPRTPGLGIEIDWDFVADHPYHGELGIGAGARPAFGLAGELLPDREAQTLR